MKEQCELLDIAPTSATRIHIGKISISKFATEESNYKETYKSVLNITCDLRPYLPSKNSQVFIENKVNHDAWYFWADSDFTYKFEITSYPKNLMKLKLVESDFRFANYEEKYPLRTPIGTELALERPINECKRVEWCTPLYTFTHNIQNNQLSFLLQKEQLQFLYFSFLPCLPASLYMCFCHPKKL